MKKTKLGFPYKLLSDMLNYVLLFVWILKGILGNGQIFFYVSEEIFFSENDPNIFTLRF